LGDADKMPHILCRDPAAGAHDRSQFINAG
jgi:hypothetical protein